MISRDVTYSTTESLKDNTSISSNVDPKSLLPYIQSAELMNVLPIIGVALDSDLKQKIIDNNLTGTSQTLVYEYILPVSAYASWLDSSTFMYSKTTNKGLVHQTSDSSTTIDFETFKQYRQSIKDKLHFFKQRLVNFLEDNKTTYPLYRSEDQCEDKDINAGTSGIFLY